MAVAAAEAGPGGAGGGRTGRGGAGRGQAGPVPRLDGRGAGADDDLTVRQVDLSGLAEDLAAFEGNAIIDDILAKGQIRQNAKELEGKLRTVELESIQVDERGKERGSPH